MDIPRKFSNPDFTIDGHPRASVELRRLDTLWFNTGTLCNLTCANCYIESSPTNDRLAYLTLEDAAAYLEELEQMSASPIEVGFTGGEPFMNPDFMNMLDLTLEKGHRALVLTNAMRPMMKCADRLLALPQAHKDRLTLRVSIDHYDEQHHAQERGPKSWSSTLAGLNWLVKNGFRAHVAGRTYWDENEASLRAGYAELFAQLDIPLDSEDTSQLVLFPEMDGDAEVPEISESCWGILNVSPDDMMCASSRMVVRRRGAKHAEVTACTLLPYDPEFSLGSTLTESARPVSLNHPHCARFCVLGGGSCSQ